MSSSSDSFPSSTRRIMHAPVNVLLMDAIFMIVEGVNGLRDSRSAYPNPFDHAGFPSIRTAAPTPITCAELISASMRLSREFEEYLPSWGVVQEITSRLNRTIMYFKRFGIDDEKYK